MTEYDQDKLARELSNVRRLHGHTLEQLARRLGVTKSYLSKIENGHKPVSNSVLRRYATVYTESAKFLELIGGGHKVKIQTNEGESKQENMDQQLQVQPPAQELQVNLNPEKTPTLFTDWQNVSINDGGVVINFGQTMSPVQAVNIASRIGLSHAQAKQLHGTLDKVLREYYKTKDMEF